MNKNNLPLSYYFRWGGGAYFLQVWCWPANLVSCFSSSSKLTAGEYTNQAYSPVILLPFPFIFFFWWLDSSKYQGLNLWKKRVPEVPLRFQVFTRLNSQVAVDMVIALSTLLFLRHIAVSRGRAVEGAWQGRIRAFLEPRGLPSH